MKKWLKISLITIISLVLLLTGAFFIYVSDYYKADDVAIAVMQSEAVMCVQDNIIMLSSIMPSLVITASKRVTPMLRFQA